MQVLSPQEDSRLRVPIKMWVDGVELEHGAKQQLINTATLPFIYKHIAVMPDVHLGRGATIGSVIPTQGAIIPAAVGVDIGCGMMALRTNLTASNLPDSLEDVRSQIEAMIPVGMEGYDHVPSVSAKWWRTLIMDERFKVIEARRKEIKVQRAESQIGTLGGGNHFIEVCLDTHQDVWVMLHSGSRGIGNKIGQYFITLAKEDMRTHFINLPDQDLAYLSEGTEHFDDYVAAVGWAQDYALYNRRVMMERVLEAMRDALGRSVVQNLAEPAVSCHHNYIARENHFGANVWVTRKGAVRARAGELGIIPGSMGARSYIVRGRGNRDSFESCAHGAGRRMSRSEARKTFTLSDHHAATLGVACRKDAEVLDETPGAYKSIDAVMKAQEDLVEIVYELKQVACVKG